MDLSNNMKDKNNLNIKLYKNTYNQIATNIAEIKRMQDKECFLDHYDKLSELHEETIILIADAKELFFKNIEHDYKKLVNLEECLDKLIVQFNLEE